MSTATGTDHGAQTTAMTSGPRPARLPSARAPSGPTAMAARLAPTKDTAVGAASLGPSTAGRDTSGGVTLNGQQRNAPMRVR